MMRTLRIPVAFLGSVLAASVLSAVPGSALAEEGMWTFDNPPLDAIEKAYGFRPTPEWLEEVRLSAVKIGSSGSFVSPKGLVMTNHHVAVGCLQQLSTKEDDLVANGFLARTHAEERPCPEIQLDQLVGIEDVTAKIEKATRGKADAAYARARDAEITRLEKACSASGRKKGWFGRKKKTADPLRCEVVKLYQGGQYHLYEYRTYRDLRLVFAPEVSIASFGGDPDNYNFPRYNLDATFLRVWEDGKPLATPHHFRWSAGGAKEGEVVFIAGHPRTTERGLTAAQLTWLRDAGLPDKLYRLAELRGRLIEFGHRSPDHARMARRDLYSTENLFKRYHGQLRALDDAMIARKRAEENELRERVGALQGGDPWEAIAKAQDAKHRLDDAYLQLESSQGLETSRALALARKLVRGAAERAKPAEERLEDYRPSTLPRVEQIVLSTAPMHRELEAMKIRFALTKLREKLSPDHPAVRTALGTKSPEALAEEIASGSKVFDPEWRASVWKGGAKALAAAADDPAIALMTRIDAAARETRAAWEAEVEGPEDRHGNRIAEGRFQVYGTKVYPDATGTMRLSYGTMKGYTAADGREVAPFTTFGGVFERHTGAAPFSLPPRWIEAKEKLDPGTPFNFVTNTDTHGGNSGSPVFNARREIVGLLFDRNTEGLGNAFTFDDTRGRTVSVHSAAILESLRTVYGADALVDELTD